MLPLFKSSGAMSGDSLYQNLELIDFPSEFKTCGARQAAIMPFLQPDYTPYAQFDDLLLTNVGHDALTFIENPPQGWANIEDCVEFTCTGMYNIVMYFENVRSSGTGLFPRIGQTFTIISNNIESTSAQVIPTCEL